VRAFYVDAEELILSSANGQIKSLQKDREIFVKRIAAVCDHFGSDIDGRSLTLQLEMLNDLMDDKQANNSAYVTDALQT